MSTDGNSSVEPNWTPFILASSLVFAITLIVGVGEVRAKDANVWWAITGAVTITVVFAIIWSITWTERYEMEHPFIRILECWAARAFFVFAIGVVFNVIAMFVEGMIYALFA